MKIHFSSFIKAGSTAAVVAGLLLLIALTPFFSDLLPIILVAGALFIPLGAGVYYGKLAPGEETMTQSIIGGALSGLVGGIILGMAFGLNRFMIELVSGFVGYAIAGGLLVTLTAGAILGLLGLIMGALGGVIWQFLQRPETSEPKTQESAN